MSSIRRSARSITRRNCRIERLKSDSEVMMPGTRSFNQCETTCGHGWKKRPSFRDRTCAVPELAGPIRHLNGLIADETKTDARPSACTGVIPFRRLPATECQGGQTVKAAGAAD